MTDRPKPETVLVTGAGGLIGSAICKELLESGMRARALLARGESDINLRGTPPIEIREGDIRDLSLLKEISRGCDGVIHAAALNKLWHRPSRDYYEINVTGTANACLAAKDARVRRFIYTSSCEVMGPALPGPLADENRAAPLKKIRGHYERSKRMAEDVVRKFSADGLQAIIIRPTAVIGPGDIHKTPPGRLLRNLLSRSTRAYYDAGINVVDSRDVAKAHAAAIRHGSIGETYIIGAHNIRLDELIEIIERKENFRIDAMSVGYTAAHLTAILLWTKSLITGRDPGITVSGIRTVKHPWHFDSSKARKELGFDPRPLEETVRDAIDWIKNNEA